MIEWRHALKLALGGVGVMRLQVWQCSHAPHLNRLAKWEVLHRKLPPVVPTLLIHSLIILQLPSGKSYLLGIL